MTRRPHAHSTKTSDIRIVEYAEFASLSSELIQGSGCLRFRAQGNSMLPTIHNGDILTVEKSDPNTLAMGDVVMIQTASGSVLVHRIIKQDGHTWTPCGDARLMHDAPFTADQLIGIVRSIEHHGKIRRLSNIWGRFMAVVSRYGKTLVGRITKRLITLCGRPR